MWKPATEKRGDARGITPRQILLAAETQALEELLVALVGGQLEVVKQLATTCDHLKEASTCGMIFLMRAKVLREIVDSLRQEGHLDVGAAGVFFVDLEGGGIDGGCFAHGSFEWPDNLSGGGCSRMWGREGTINALFGKRKFGGEESLRLFAVVGGCWPEVGEFTVVYSG